jgi:hypothetical protein
LLKHQLGKPKPFTLRTRATLTEKLSLTSPNWNPSIANSYLTLTWDKEGYSLSPGAVVTATLTLTVASQIGSLTTFDFDFSSISGTG